MTNIFSLGEARASRENDSVSAALDYLEGKISTTIDASVRYGRDSDVTITKFTEACCVPSDPEGTDNPHIAKITNTHMHVWEHVLKAMPGLLKYTKCLEVDSLFGGSSIILTSTTQNTDGENPPDPVLIYATGTNPFGDGKEWAACSISCRSFVFDTDIEDYDGPAIIHHPKRKSDKGHLHLDTVPYVKWCDSFDSMRRGLSHPLLVEDMLKQFTKVGINCNGGVAYRREEGRHNFSYLIPATPNTILEWNITLLDTVYELDFPFGVMLSVSSEFGIFNGKRKSMF